MACDQSAHDRVCQVTEKELEMGNKAVWSIGHMPNLKCGAGDMPRMQLKLMEWAI